MTSSRSTRPGQSQLRIIGGQWRSRKLLFTPAQGLRPTTDRVRETLFNWLAPFISEARCADLFAGTGALGLEALSRGATHCDFVDDSRGAIKQIACHLATLEADQRGRCHPGTASDYLSNKPAPLDIVFVDPPFGQGLIAPTCKALSTSQSLAAQALVYVESPVGEALTDLPPDWQTHRQKTAGSVVYSLFQTGAA